MEELRLKQTESKIVLAIEKSLSLSFSQAASSVVNERSSQYFNNLIEESIVIGKRDQTDIISAKHVEIATYNLTAHSREKLNQHIGTWGGIFLGSSLSALISMIMVNQFPISGVVAVTLLGICGSYLLGRSLNN